MGDYKHSLDGKESFCFDRRQFLNVCASCFAYSWAISLARGAGRILIPEEINLPREKAKVRLVFCHISPDKPTWPYQGYDYEARKRELTSRLRKTCSDVEFFPVTLQNGEEAKKLLEADQDVDGYLVYIVGIWTGVPQIIAFSGRPTILVDDLYAGSGEFLIQYAAAKRQEKRVVGISSSRFDDVVEAIKCFEVMRKLRSSIILDVTDAQSLGEAPRAIKEVFGAEVKQIPSPEINEAYKKADKGEAKKWASCWIDEAERVVEPTREEIEKSAAMYLAELALLEKYRAQAIAIDCLGLFYGGKLPAYPCLGFFQLNNDGRVGACEADLASTIVMLMMSYLVSQPGYISDPVIDTATNQIIYAHCVAPNKVFGPKGPANPFHIRSHSEDRKGAAVRSFMPPGEMTTTIEWNLSRNEMVFHQAITVGNVEEDKACRTKLAAEVKGNIHKLLGEWDRFGWHRVTFYGDHKKAVEMMTVLLGIKLILEA